MSTLLVTVIFLLATGAPAKDAVVRCQGIAVIAAGDDEAREVSEGMPLILDSRGASVMSVPTPTTITCTAEYETWRYHGAIRLEHHGQVTRIYLDKES